MQNVNGIYGNIFGQQQTLPATGQPIYQPITFLREDECTSTLCVFTVDLSKASSHVHFGSTCKRVYGNKTIETDGKTIKTLTKLEDGRTRCEIYNIATQKAKVNYIPAK